MNIIFMGTPKFSIPILESLARQGNAIVGVVTRPDKPSGRGRKMEESPLKIYANHFGYKVLQPKNFRSAQAVDEISQLKPDIFVVAAYGAILPQSLLDIPRYGVINLHPSLLPKYRGPSPVATAILNGEAVTGISVMYLDSGIDTGPVLSQLEEPIRSDDTTESLTTRLFSKGRDLLLTQISLLRENHVSLTPQDSNEATMTKMLRREDGLIDFQMSAENLERQVRAFYPWPGTYTFWDGQMLKIIGAECVSTANSGLMPGTVIKWTENSVICIAVVTGSELLQLHKVQLAGKKQMEAHEFSAGHPRFEGSVLPT